MLCHVLRYKSERKAEHYTVELSDSLRPCYERMVSEGYVLASQVLISKSVCASIRDGDGDLSIRVVPNDPDDIRDAFETMLRSKFPV